MLMCVCDSLFARPSCPGLTGPACWSHCPHDAVAAISRKIPRSLGGEVETSASQRTIGRDLWPEINLEIFAELVVLDRHHDPHHRLGSRSAVKPPASGVRRTGCALCLHEVPLWLRLGEQANANMSAIAVGKEAVEERWTD